MYRSPFRLVDLYELPPDPDGRKRALYIQKKKLLAEFELADCSAITINGEQLGRQDAISLLDELQNPSLFLFHRVVWRDAALLHFLEQGVLMAGDWLNNAVYQRPVFLQFISPHFADAANCFLQRALNEHVDEEVLQTFQRNARLLLPADYEKAYRYAIKFLFEKKNQLLAVRHRLDSTTQVSSPDLSKYLTKGQILVLNILPDEFATPRFALAEVLNNICAVVAGTDWCFALAAIELAASIDVADNNLKHLIERNLHICRLEASKLVYHLSDGKRAGSGPLTDAGKPYKKAYDFALIASNVPKEPGKSRYFVGMLVLAILLLIWAVLSPEGCGG